MATKQLNVKLSEELLKKAEAHVENFGFNNVQELIRESLREKVFVLRYDETFTQKEIAFIDRLIKESLQREEIISEEELIKVLRA